MRQNMYRGTDLNSAREEEFATRSIHGRTLTVVSGWMGRDHIEEDWSAHEVDELPWDDGPNFEEVDMTGGMSDRLGAATAFGNLVFALNKSAVGNASLLQYTFEDFDARPGTMPWYDGTASGELRINDELLGLLNCQDGECNVTYYGDNLRSRARHYADELEWVVRGTDRVDISGAVRGVTLYTLDPKRALASIEGYASMDTRLAQANNDTVIEDWDDEKVMQVLYGEVAQDAPGEWPIFIVDANTRLVNETWGYDESDIDGVYDGESILDAANAPNWVLGD